MRLKSYFVHSVDEAIRQAKCELGGDAMLVDTKLLAPHTGNRSRLEVIFAAPTQSPAPPPIAASSVAPPPNNLGPLNLREFRGGLTNLLGALSGPPGAHQLSAGDQSSPATEWLNASLAAADVPVEARRRFADDWQEIPVHRGSPATAVATFLASRMPKQEISHAERRRIALIGPLGSGKTTVTAKLAYKLGIEKGVAPLVISLDNIKIGASDQLSRLCRLLGVAFQPIENYGDLRSILDENEHRRLILIDTPGLHTGDPNLAGDMNTCLKGPVVIERHFVLPAPARATCMEAWLDLAEPLSIDCLLFTRLDETEFHGPMWSLAATRHLPLSWISSGPRMPEDLETANIERICDAIAGSAAPSAPLRARAASAGASLS